MIFVLEGQKEKKNGREQEEENKRERKYGCMDVYIRVHSLLHYKFWGLVYNYFLENFYKK